MASKETGKSFNIGQWSRVLLLLHCADKDAIIRCAYCSQFISGFLLKCIKKNRIIVFRNFSKVEIYDGEQVPLTIVPEYPISNNNIEFPYMFLFQWPLPNTSTWKTAHWLTIFRPIHNQAYYNRCSHYSSATRISEAQNNNSTPLVFDSICKW